MSHSKSKSFHIVLSPKELVHAKPIVSYFNSNDGRYVVALEYGTNGHAHLECYVVFPKEYRQDHVRRAVIKLYPDVPQDERKNIKICVNTLDPDERYGFGYALKENNEKLTNLSLEYQSECLEYYFKNMQKIKDLQHTYKSKGKMTIDDIASGLVGYVTDYLNGSKYSSVTHNFLIKNYLISIKSLLSFSTYQKINQEKLQEFLEIQFGAQLLTAPSPPKVNIITSEIHPMLQ